MLCWCGASTERKWKSEAKSIRCVCICVLVLRHTGSASVFNGISLDHLSIYNIVSAMQWRWCEQKAKQHSLTADDDDINLMRNEWANTNPYKLIGWRRWSDRIHFLLLFFNFALYRELNVCLGLVILNFWWNESQVQSRRHWTNVPFWLTVTFFPVSWS